jgi:hypothetical protein
MRSIVLVATTPEVLALCKVAQNNLGLLTATTREKNKLLRRKHILLLTPPCQQRVHYPRKKLIHNWTDINQAVIAWVRPVTLLE